MIKQIATNRIDYGELDELISKHYNLSYTADWTIVADEEASNNTTLEYHLTKGIDLAAWESAKLFQFISRYKYLKGPAPQFVTRAILQDLCNQGVIPEGLLSVRISWLHQRVL